VTPQSFFPPHPNVAFAFVVVETFRDGVQLRSMLVGSGRSAGGGRPEQPLRAKQPLPVRGLPGAGRAGRAGAGAGIGARVAAGDLRLVPAAVRREPDRGAVLQLELQVALLACAAGRRHGLERRRAPSGGRPPESVVPPTSLVRLASTSDGFRELAACRNLRLFREPRPPRRGAARVGGRSGADRGAVPAEPSDAA
jgi:hypothetical protein